MKKILLIFTFIVILLLNALHAQDRSTLRAARMSFNAAERNLKDGNYAEAAKDYIIVHNSIPVSTDSRRDLEMRMQSLIGLINIFFNKTLDLTRACDYVRLYISDMEVVKSGDVLRASDRLLFLRKEQEYFNDYIPKCKAYERLDRDAEEFKKHFEDQIKRN